MMIYQPHYKKDEIYLRIIIIILKIVYHHMNHQYQLREVLKE